MRKELTRFLCLFISLLFCTNVFSRDKEKTLKVALFSGDPNAVDALNSIVSPDSHAIVNAVHDQLFYPNSEGKLSPGLATSWEQLSSTQ